MAQSNIATSEILVGFDQPRTCLHQSVRAHKGLDEAPG